MSPRAASARSRSDYATAYKQATSARGGVPSGFRGGNLKGEGFQLYLKYTYLSPAVLSNILYLIEEVKRDVVDALEEENGSLFENKPQLAITQAFTGRSITFRINAFGIETEVKTSRAIGLATLIVGAIYMGYKEYNAQRGVNLDNDIKETQLKINRIELEDKEIDLQEKKDSIRRRDSALRLAQYIDSVPEIQVALVNRTVIKNTLPKKPIVRVRRRKH